MKKQAVYFVSLGPDVIFTRTPVHDLAGLRKLKLWRWDLDEIGIATSRDMGLNIVPLPVADAGRAYDDGRVDGFLAIPLASLAFQWSSRARYVTDLRGSYIWSCLVMTRGSRCDARVSRQREAASFTGCSGPSGRSTILLSTLR